MVARKGNINMHRIIFFCLIFIASICQGAEELDAQEPPHRNCPKVTTKSPPKYIPGRSGKERLRFIQCLNDDDPFRQAYYSIALKDKNDLVRGHGAYMISSKLSQIAPRLLKLIATDSSKQVKLSAALNLECQFTCNGADYSPQDIKALEKNVSLLERTIRDDVGGRYVAETLSVVWCDLTANTRSRLRKVFVSYDLDANIARTTDMNAKYAAMSRAVINSCSKRQNDKL